VLIAATMLAGGYLLLQSLEEDEAAARRGQQASAPDAAAPTPGPTAAPTPTPEPRGRLVIHGTGDVNLDPSYISSFAANGYEYAWSGLDGLFLQDDLTVVNLECPASDAGAIIPKEFNFRCDPDALPAMRRAGVEVANQANNHGYDYGPEALMDSVANLRRAGIEPVGAGRDDRAALRPAILEIDGWTVAVVGLGMVVDPAEGVAGPDHPGIAAGHDTDAMLRAIREAESRADLVVVTIHWGVELDTEPRTEQVALGQEFVEAGADIVFGHHAHRLQPLTHYRGRPIFWGLGNFVWPNFSAEGSTTAVARAIVRPDGSVRGMLLPAFIEAPGHPVLTG
jgi:poly-gamma-glutamate capsule biosynthesis protein CapA/YwtB (metallophosphatase superfamily)